MSLAGRRSIDWEPDRLGDYDAVLICTDHDDIDYATRAVTEGRDKIIMA